MTILFTATTGDGNGTTYRAKGWAIVHEGDEARVYRVGENGQERSVLTIIGTECLAAAQRWVSRLDDLEAEDAA